MINESLHCTVIYYHEVSLTLSAAFSQT